MKIFKADHKDLRKIADLRKNTIQNVSAKYFEKGDIRVLLSINSYYNLKKRYNHADMFLIKEKNKILGTIDLQKNKIKGVYTEHNSLGKGIGTIMMDFIEDLARKKGLKKVYLDTNDNAIGFYKKRGYVLKKKKLPSGKLIKRIIYVMEKTL